MDETENIAASLVREYLSRKGLKNTLQVLDDEYPRSSSSVTNRMDLMKALHLQGQMKRNKEDEKPYKTMLEVMTKYYTEKGSKQGKNTPPIEDDNIGRPHSLKLTSKKKHGDLVIDDDIEGELTMGEGKAGLMGKVEGDDMYNVGVIRTGGKPANPSRMRGMSGPVTSNVETQSKDRQWKFGRPLSHDEETATADKTTAKKSQQSIYKTSSFNMKSNFGPTKETQSDEANNNNNSKKKTLDDILNARKDDVHSKKPDIRRSSKHKDDDDNIGIDYEGFNSFDGGGYNVARSSIASEGIPLRPPSSSGSSGSNSNGRGDSTQSGSPVRKQLQQSPLKVAGNKKVGDIEVGDVEDEFETGFADLKVERRTPLIKPNIRVQSKPIDLQTAIDLKLLLFGSVNRDFSEEWKYQGFTFSEVKRLQYGFVQKKGGSCGVLASVQAVVLQELLFTQQNKKASPSYTDELIDSLQPSPVKRSDCLSKALAKILWRAGNYERAVVTAPTGRPQFQLSNKFKGDNLTETLILYTFETFDDLLCHLQQNNAQFELHGNNGVIHSLFSIVLSRSIKSVREDMDEPTNKLIGAHNYCSQDLVNLYITGHAVSNVFNDIVELDSGGSNTTVLKGTKGRSDIGFLSLFEHYKSCQVGTYYKTPIYPIWLICSESHFSVLFALNKDLMNNWRSERRFDLYYYDGLANQDAEIRLTLDTTNRYYKPPTDDDLVPPIDLCIRTKWEDAEIDWNGTEPLL